MADLGIDCRPVEHETDLLREAGQTVMYLAIDGKLSGYIGVADPVKGTTPEAVRQLKDSGVRIVMLTGDNEVTARAFSEVPAAATAMAAIAAAAMSRLFISLSLSLCLRRRRSSPRVICAFLMGRTVHSMQRTVYTITPARTIPYFPLLLLAPLPRSALPRLPIG